MESSNDTANGSNIEVPLYISYLKLVVVTLAPIVLAVPTGLVLRVIIKEETLHNKYYFLVGNLLATDFLAVAVESLLQTIGLILHVAGYPVQFNCALIKVFEIPTSTSRLLYATLGIDRFIAIAYPYHHRKIMTNKFVVGIVAAVWAMAIATNSILASGAYFEYVPAFAKCFGLGGFPLGYGLWVALTMSSTGLIIAINIYLYRQILESNNKRRENMQLAGSDTMEATNHKMLKSHVKPAVSVLLLGGLDGIFNLAVPITHIILRLIYGSNSLTRLYFVEFLIYAIEFCQVICHPLVYGIYMTAIRKKLFDFELYHRIFNRWSNVIVLNRQ